MNYHEIKNAVIDLSPIEAASSTNPIKKIGGVTLVQRAIITGTRAGIQNFYLWDHKENHISEECYQKQKKCIEKILQEDGRISCSWQWIESIAEYSGKEDVFLYYHYQTLLNVKTLEKFCKSENRIECASQKGNYIRLAKLGFQNLQFSFSFLETLPKRDIEGFIEHLDVFPKKTESRLLESLQSPLEGMVDVYFNRPIGRWIALPLARTGIHPNFVSLVSIGIGILSAICFLSGHYWQSIIAAFMLQISAILDCIDGDVARIQFKESKLGRWLDITGDNIVHIALFICLGIREYHLSPDTTIILLCSLLVFATIVSFFLVLYVQTSLKSAIKNTPFSASFVKLEKFIDKMTSRDFTVLLILGSFLGNLTWFLWLSAIGSQFFWILLVFRIFIAKKNIRNQERKNCS
ncbi:MAG: CDP-alcohol phosphatidyltransferase family protein [Candidatus Brocadiae bacterium]|nr:CDP-alcohol phosphatidyltransferase family protein [Candidatus Brocadiia bacterium]